MASSSTSYDNETGWESICYKTTASGDEILPGTKRHDDQFPSPGFYVFNTAGQRVDNAPGYQQVSCDSCCPTVLAEGCWNDGTNTGRWTSVLLGDGTVEVRDVASGDLVPEGDVVACPSSAYRTEVRTVNQNSTYAIPGGATNLVSWSIRVRQGTPTLALSGVSTVLDLGEVVSSSTQDDRGVLDDVPVITTGANQSVRVSFTLRTAP